MATDNETAITRNTCSRRERKQSIFAAQCHYKSAIPEYGNCKYECEQECYISTAQNMHVRNRIEDNQPAHKRT
eukprot:9311395-Pyramimonas_sp.AAC.1